jgi:hypothetical protein
MSQQSASHHADLLFDVNDVVNTSRSKLTPSRTTSDRRIDRKKKRKRTVICPKELEKLENLFQVEPWPSRSSKETLAFDIGKSENFISVWFQNRRARMRRETKSTSESLETPVTIVPSMPTTRSRPTVSASLGRHVTHDVHNTLKLNLKLKFQTSSQTKKRKQPEQIVSGPSTAPCGSSTGSTGGDGGQHGNQFIKEEKPDTSPPAQVLGRISNSRYLYFKI